MILIVEHPQQLEPPAPFANREHECSLQLTLRRMGFYAARPATARRKRDGRPTLSTPIRWHHDDA